MYLLSKLAISRVLAVVLAMTLFGFGVPALQAKHKNHNASQTQTIESQTVETVETSQGQCPAPVRQKPTPPPMCCPAPVREKPTPPPVCCPAPVLQKPSAPEPVSCCPVDPKEVRKAEKAAEHAQHEAAEACKRQQKEAAKAQDRIDKAVAKGDHEVAEANAKLQTRTQEWSQANEEYAALTQQQQPQESVAEVKETEIEIQQAKPTPVEPTPTPEAQAIPEPTPAPAPESTVAQAEPAPAPAPETPKELPRTASDLNLLGLVGLLSTMTGYLTRYFRS